MRADDWCDDCHSYGHSTWCPAYKPQLKEETPKDFKVSNVVNHVFTCVRCSRQWTVVSSEELECFFCGLCYWCILETKVTQAQIQSALADLLKQK